MLQFFCRLLVSLISVYSKFSYYERVESVNGVAELDLTQISGSEVPNVNFDISIREFDEHSVRGLHFISLLMIMFFFLTETQSIVETFNQFNMVVTRSYSSHAINLSLSCLYYNVD